MKTAVIALATVLALSGGAFAKDAKQNSQPAAPQSTTFVSKRFIDPQTTGSIATARDTAVPAPKRLGGGIDPSVLPNFH